MTWPSLSYVAEDHKGRIVGYILAKMCVPLRHDAYIHSSLPSAGRKLKSLRMAHHPLNLLTVTSHRYLSYGRTDDSD
ncbi:hypothetical protein JVT61DRAFT_13004 [Boletus reticuloceps]|uniref:Uncharacterized protein n=1 Tax=Boletus reticuloceps TaxID=495285 RepID=A0A8I2YUR5_9AGAM|nr:hypothetical protein JVT61DRAFT_13004 [Boletus reticuloceps]